MCETRKGGLRHVSYGLGHVRQDVLTGRPRHGEAKALAVYKGREKVISPERIKELRLAGLDASAIARQLGCSRMTVYRELKALEAVANLATG